MPAQSFEFWIVFRRKNPKQLSYNTKCLPTASFSAPHPLRLCRVEWKKEPQGKRFSGLDGLIRCCWEAVASETICFRFVVFSLQGGRGALTFWSVWLLALFFKSSTGKEWLESFLRVLIQDYLSALLVNSHGVLTALLKCYNTKYSPYPTLNEVN